ncbi:MAG: amidohydrolase family protein [Candidatus Eisenbacteria bacterium]|nr:amidohydrolase family protein [Candidatus Eisenbacteria bacterium]
MTEGIHWPRSHPGGTVFKGGRWITMDPSDRIVEGEMFVVDGRIEQFGPKVSAPEGTPIVDLTGRWMTPGFIQGHVHLGQTLFRGLGEDRRLLDWLSGVIWPLEAAHDDESAYWSAVVGGAEAMRAGTTSMLDIGLVHGMNGLFRGLIDLGVRARTGKLLMDRGDGVPPALLGEPDRILAESHELARHWDGVDNGRIGYAVCPRFVFSCTPALWEGAVAQARGGNWPLHTHAFETREEQEAVRAVEHRSELDTLRDVGALTVPLKVAHGVWVDDPTAERLGGAGAAVIHCPASNLKLGSGVADLERLKRHGVRVGIGCDGSPCNNFLDPLGEMRLAALLQKWRHGPDRFTARDALSLATREGALAIDAEDRIGSLEVGKRADFVVFDLERVHSLCADAVDPYTRIVFGADRTNIESVYIEGRAVVDRGQIPGFEDKEIMARGREALHAVLARAGRFESTTRPAKMTP